MREDSGGKNKQAYGEKDRAVNAVRIVFLILSLLWMAQMFYFSSRTAVESTGNSNPIVEFVAEHLIPGYNGLSAQAKLKLLGIVTLLVRKAAHVFEYAVLTLLLSPVFAVRIKPSGRNKEDSANKRAEAARGVSLMGLLLPAVVSLLYAVFDEIHQTFVPGRSGEVKDVLVDCIGIAIAVGIIRLIGRGRGGDPFRSETGESD